ncbi:MAG: hypothetical protein FWD97_07025 [Defluviitaleaceae bacterium]|nr:hypothetical protein [Defluviitaleaceae bacterium]
MKKIILPALLLVFGLVLFAGCGNRDGDASPLVGSWDWEDTLIGYYVFNADGTGIRHSVNHFEWHTDGDLLTLNFVSGPLFDSHFTNNELWTWVMTDNNTLTITSRHMEGFTWTYTRGN